MLKIENKKSIWDIHDKLSRIQTLATISDKKGGSKMDNLRCQMKKKL